MSHSRLQDLLPLDSPASGSVGSESLPDDLAAEAAGRLRVAAVVLLCLWLVGMITNHLIVPFLGLRADEIIPWVPIADLLGAASIALSVAVFYIAPGVARRPGRLAVLAMAYEVAVAFAIGVINQWQPVALAGRLSWICVIILLFPLLAPSSPRTVLIGSLLAATMDPVGLVIAHLRGLELPSVTLLAWTYFPNYICAGFAVLHSRIMAHLGRKVSRARQLGSYRLVEQIGRGGMGEVWRAEHRLFARPAAIKLVAGPSTLESSGGIAEERFRREAQVAAGLRCPHTIQLYDFGVTRDRRLYYVMELLDGCDLESLVRRYGPQPPTRVAYILRQACRSLAEAHAVGLVHRDVKPANLHIGRIGLEYDFVKVLDFGLVKQQSGPGMANVELTAPQAISGTPAYMAPEMASGDPVAGRADLYAVGCVGYFLLTGTRLFEGEHPMQVLLHHIRSAPVPPSVRIGRPVPAALENLLMRCLAKDPVDRPDATALAEALGAAGADRWTQREAREWWETTYTPPASSDRGRPPATTLLELAHATSEPSE